MRRFNVLFCLVSLLLISQFNYAQTIVGSMHDFSLRVWNPGGEICIVCHSPHVTNLYTPTADAPLWNHQTTATNFTLYTSSTLNATTGQPDGSSKLCLSCHDGTVALANFSGASGGTAYVSSSNNLGTTIANDHPISFTYDAALATADGDLFDPTTTTSGIGTTIAADMLIGGKMQCASCHDVHNGYGLPYLLKKDNTASELCLTCHNK